ncbi:MAG: hypothetical protein Q4B22_09285 [Eubacteriales bacterium]|nr:hypothetical protein [Eubacteriales bacterium]
MEEIELFKTTAFGGYDKDDVNQELQKIKDGAYQEKSRMEKEIAALKKELAEKDDLIRRKNARVQDLQEALAARDREILDMEKRIKEKYQTYIDNYDTIGSLIFEAKVRAKEISRETESERSRILEQAQEEADLIRENAKNQETKILADIDKRIEERNRIGKQQYNAVQEELGNVVEIFNRVQKQFMNSYREIQRIVSTGETSEHEDDAYDSYREDGGEY